MQKILLFFALNDTAEKAINFYTFVFKDAKIGNIVRYYKAGAEPPADLKVR